MNLGDSVTTDHISPAGSIARNSPAARYLTSRGYVYSTVKKLQIFANISYHLFLLIFRLTPKEFNSYGSRRGNDAVMARGTFANIRLVNKFVTKAGPRTIYIPTKEEVCKKIQINLIYPHNVFEYNHLFIDGRL